MKTSLLFKGTSVIRARSHGSIPSPIHDNIALWMDHYVSFDIPVDQMDKVTIVMEIIVKSKEPQEGDDEKESGLLEGMLSPKKIQVPAISLDNEKSEKSDKIEESIDIEGKAEETEEKVLRRRVGKVVLGNDASSEDGRRQWNEAVDSSRQEVLYWHKLY